MGVEAFTVMAILDAQDRASAIFEKASVVFDGFTKSVEEAAVASETSGFAIDEAMSLAASGVTNLELSTVKLDAAILEEKAAIQELAAAEQALIDMMQQGILFDDELTAATDRLSLAERDAAKATAEVEAARVKANFTTKESVAVTDEAAVAAEASSSSMMAVAVGFAAAGVLAIKAAGDFQSTTTHLVTDAGETAGALKTVQDGLIAMSGQVGFSANELATAMYHVESAGFHAASGGLDVMRVAAEGAKVGNADLDTVSKTLAGTMDAYGAKAGDAAKFMNELIETTAKGDLRMQDLATSLGAVTGIAAAAGLQFSQVGGAIATMTSQNMTAQQATQNLAHFITSMSKPTSIQIKEMQQMGLDSNDLSSKLGERGLTGTLKILVDAIGKHTQGGQVFIDSLNNSTHAADDAKKMLSLMPPEIKKLSEELANGKMGVKDYTKAIGELDPTQDKMGKQFLATQESMGAFNKLLSSGSPQAQTFNAALSDMTGGQVGLRTALMLSIDGGRYFNDAASSIQETANGASKQVQNWNTIQATFNQKMSEAKAGVEALGVNIGMILIPYAQKLVGWLGSAADWFSRNKTAAETLAVVIGSVMVGAVVALGVAFLAAFGPEIAITAAILAAAAAIVYAYNHFKIFHDVILAIGHFLQWEFTTAWKVAGAVVDWFRTDVLPLVQKGIKELIEWWGDHKEEFKKDWDQVVHDVEKLVKWFKDNVLTWVQAKLDEFNKWWKAHSAEIHVAWKDVWDMVSTTLKVVFDVIGGILRAAFGFWSLIWNLFADMLKTVWGGMADTVTIFIHVIKNIIDIVLDVINGRWGAAWGDLKKLVVQAFNDIKKAIEDLTSNFGTLLEDAGKNLIKGLISGIKATVGALKSTVGDVAKGIKGFFNQSPAKEGPLSGTGGPDYMGATFGKMLADGIRNSASSVASASKFLASAANPHLSAAYTGAGTGLTALGGAGTGGGGGSTVIFDMRGTQLMSDRDMDVFVDKVGRRVATRILPAGGVRIRA